MSKSYFTKIFNNISDINDILLETLTMLDSLKSNPSSYKSIFTILAHLCNPNKPRKIAQHEKDILNKACHDITRINLEYIEGE